MSLNIMTDSNQNVAVALKAKKILNLSTVLWFIITFLGQWLFVYYILFSYGGKAVSGNIGAWADSTIKGNVPGDYLGNWMFVAHLLLAIILTIGGTLQLIPKIRECAIQFHRYNGRLFILTAFGISLGGLYLIWIRNAVVNLNSSIAATLNALLILIFSTLAIRFARVRNISAHRKWALRAFIVVNGVWFFRIGFMAWILINQGAVGSTENLDGPFDLVWAYANYLLPLLILELYLYAKDSPKSSVKKSTSIVLLLCSIITVIGIVGAYKILWRPHL